MSKKLTDAFAALSIRNKADLCIRSDDPCHAACECVHVSEYQQDHRAAG